MKKYIYLILIIQILFSLSAHKTLAQTEEGITLEEQSKILDLDQSTSSVIPPYPGSTSFLGQEQDYSVVFRGNGEAVVNMKVIFTNSSNDIKDKFILRLPKGDPKELVAFQVFKEPGCIRYDTSYTPSETLPSRSPEGEAVTLSCLEYGSIDYRYGYGMQYIKAESKIEGDTISIVLPKPVKTNSQGAFFVHFRTFGYVEKNIFGAFGYTFETLKADAEINTLNVGISTDSDLKLRGARADVNYRYQDFGAMEIQSPLGVEFKNSSLDSFYGQIGLGTITKTASSLSPFESFTVEGIYAKSIPVLYAKELIITLAVLVFVVLIIAFGVKAILKRSAKAGGEQKDLQQVESAKITVNLIITLGTGFFSSALIIAYTFLLFFLLNFFNSGYYSLQMVIAILIVVVSFLVYSLLFFGPALVIGYKRGWVWGIVTVACSLISLLLLSFVVIVVLQAFPMDYPQPIRGL